MKRKKLIMLLVNDELSNIEQLVIAGDTKYLEEWLRPILTNAHKKEKTKLIKETCIARCLLYKEEEDKL